MSSAAFDVLERTSELDLRPAELAPNDILEGTCSGGCSSTTNAVDHLGQGAIAAIAV